MCMYLCLFRWGSLLFTSANSWSSMACKLHHKVGRSHRHWQGPSANNEENKNVSLFKKRVSKNFIGNERRYIALSSCHVWHLSRPQSWTSNPSCSLHSWIFLQTKALRYFWLFNTLRCNILVLPKTLYPCLFLHSVFSVVLQQQFGLNLLCPDSTWKHRWA